MERRCCPHQSHSQPTPLLMGLDCSWVRVGLVACCLCLADSHLPNCLESHVDVCSISQECDVLKIADASSKRKKTKQKTIYKTKRMEQSSLSDQKANHRRTKRRRKEKTKHLGMAAPLGEPNENLAC